MKLKKNIAIKWVRKNIKMHYLQLKIDLIGSRYCQGYKPVLQAYLAQKIEWVFKKDPDHGQSKGIELWMYPHF